jgi:MoaA/NifB/PqqE/SkfB family radical SAM enzyme
MEGMRRNELNNIKKVTIKPTLSCPARCSFCLPRIDNYKKLRVGLKKHLNLSDYSLLIKELATLGVEEICISGGEPTIYKDLVALVELISRYNIKVSLNTNGFKLPGLLPHLVESGLKCIGLSLYSNKRKVHDSIKNYDGITEMVFKSLEVIKELKKSKSDIELYINCVLLPYNIEEICQYLLFIEQSNVESIYLSLVQGKIWDLSFYLSINNCNIFEREIIKWMKITTLDLSNQKNDIECFIYSLKKYCKSLNNNGVYNTIINIPTYCNFAQSTLMIIANGDVHSCGMVEFAGVSIIGNIFKNSISEMLVSDDKFCFDNNYHEMCKYCTMGDSMIINIKNNKMLKE